jgi:glycerophosphoryl diester phosphodiesterase
MFSYLPRPSIFAHRGSKVHAPENTLAAFELAITHKADAIELDVKLCADGHVVVMHDNTVDRTTDGTGLVRKLPLAALKELDAGSYFDIAFRGEAIPTLEEVLDAVGKLIPINIELTNYASPGDALPAKVAELVTRHGLDRQVMFSSFNPLALIRIRRYLPKVPIGLLGLDGFAGAWTRTLLANLVPHEALHPWVGDVDKALVDRTHNRGLRLHVYTVNDPLQMRDLYTWGADGIFTDDPLLARETLAALYR